MDVKIMERILLISKGILIGLIGVLLFVVGFGFGSGQFALPTLSNVQVNDSCEGLDLRNSVICLQNDFTSWYSYNHSNVGKTLSESELMAYGGVCSHAAEWYIEKAEKLGFNAKYLSFYGKDSGHAIALIYDNGINNYCIADQFTIHCQELVNGGDVTG